MRCFVVVIASKHNNALLLEILNEKAPFLELSPTLVESLLSIAVSLAWAVCVDYVLVFIYPQMVENCRGCIPRRPG